jgi:hypothetical protein
MKGNNTLGISPGTRYVGVAIFQDGNLHDWKIRNFIGAWSENKLESTLSYIEELIINQFIKNIACKLPHSSRCSHGLKVLIEKIKEIAKRFKIDLHLYNIDQLKAYFKFDISNKEELAEYLCSKYPELIKTFNKLRASKHGYHLRAFEAISAGLHYHNNICKSE